jgi:ATP-binding protein involved in chromosome partitioning
MNSEFVTNEMVIEKLKTVMDPELHKDLVSLGMVKDVSIQSGKVTVTVELTTPACPLKHKIQEDVIQAVRTIKEVSDVEVKMTAKVPQSTNIADSDDFKIKNIIAVASGKGGVGKSTLAVNIAVSLAQSGASVGLMDADIYGPNIPTMMGIYQLPNPKDGKLIPAEAYGVKVISIGFLVKDGQPLIWRGPLLHGTIKQFIVDVDWGELDYLVVDLPPGTGDVQLSLSQHIPITCGVIVTMPQKVSIDDASRGIEMFQKLNVPIAGVIENMSGLELPDGQILDVFGTGGGEEMAKNYGLEFLGRIPLDPSIRQNGDAGSPIMISDEKSKAAKMIREISGKIAAFVSQTALK